MDFYRTAVYLGFAGLVCMAVLGVANIGSGRGHSTPHSNGSHGASGHAAPSHGGVSHGHGHAHQDGSGVSFGVRAPRASRGVKGSKNFRSNFLLSLLSPQIFFSSLLGFGATGILIKSWMPLEPWRACLAVTGGLAFEKLLMTPVWNGWLRFASTPARTLESAVCEEAIALTAFDADGCGIITIDLGGHETRVLARLKPSEQDNPLRVRAGDRLFIESVDTARNSCTVFRLP